MWGCAALMGLFFTRNPKTWVPFSTKISLNMGLLFFPSNFKNFWVFTKKIKGTYILIKIHKNGTFFFFFFFLPKWPLKYGYGFWGSSGTPPSKPNLSTSGSSSGQAQLRHQPLGSVWALDMLRLLCPQLVRHGGQFAVAFHRA